jgi:hypothetical protein
MAKLGRLFFDSNTSEHECICLYLVQYISYSSVTHSTFIDYSRPLRQLLMMSGIRQIRRVYTGLGSGYPGIMVGETANRTGRRPKEDVGLRSRSPARGCGMLLVYVVDLLHAVVVCYYSMQSISCTRLWYVTSLCSRSPACGCGMLLVAARRYSASATS